MINRFDQDAPTWDEKPHRVRLATDIASAIRRAVMIRPDMDVLDFGCGTGLVSLGFATEVATLTGVDNSSGMLDMFRKKAAFLNLPNVRSHLADLTAGDHLPGYYDLIISSMTFHHMEDVPGMIKTLTRALKPEGILCIADLDQDHGHFHSDNSGVHHFGFNHEDMIEYFRGAGLSRIGFSNAAAVDRVGNDGVERKFSVFLVSGVKLPSP